MQFSYSKVGLGGHLEAVQFGGSVGQCFLKVVYIAYAVQGFPRTRLFREYVYICVRGDGAACITTSQWPGGFGTHV